MAYKDSVDQLVGESGVPKCGEVGVGSGPIVVDDENVGNSKTAIVPGCPWYIERFSEEVPWNVRPYTYTKGTAIGIEASIGLIFFYAVNFCQGGVVQLKRCWDTRWLFKFAPIGALFGVSAVCAFLGQDALSPASYALYSQGGIIFVPIVWRMLFRTPLGILAWMHIVLISLGMVAYRIGEYEVADDFDWVGLMWVLFKVISNCLASIFAEMFLKAEPNLPLTVQVAYILPWKAMAGLFTIWALPPHGLPRRPGGFFHDWAGLTLVIVFMGLGDTIFSAFVAKTYDSVVKAICGNVGIIFPTWLISCAIGWEEVDMRKASGMLKVTGGLLVVLSSLAYAFGRSQSNRLVAEIARVTDLSVKVTLLSADLESDDMVLTACPEPSRDARDMEMRNSS